MHDAATVRLFYFRTLRPGFDAALREIMLPDLRAVPGVAGVWAGRQGPDEVGARLVVSVWSSGEAMRDALGDDPDDGRFHGEYLPEIANRQLAIMPLVLMDGSPEPLTTGIMRVARGRLLESDLATYGNLVLSYLAALRTSGAGPNSVVLASAGDRAFVMMSTWTDWAAIEVATGASASEPLRTERAGLAAFQADHYELVES